MLDPLARRPGPDTLRPVLVLGGYGTFGGRIAVRAAAAGFEVLVAGRDLAKAQAFCSGGERLTPLAIDVRTGLEDVLAKHRPFAVVDAAGPFQGSGYDVARAALSAGCHYLDIADATGFVTGISALDGEARAANVCVIAGASSVPALSGAVVRRLAEGLDSVAAVEIALSASSRGTGGRSVAAAILSYVGRPVRLRVGGRWSQAHGWQGLKRVDLEVEGSPPLRGRLVAIADVPDLLLLPDRLPGRPSVVFRAGTDAPWHNLGLWLLSWPVRWGWIRQPERMAGFLSRLQHWTRGPGSARSGFQIRMFGRRGPRRVERRWTLLAERGEGPEIPSLAVPLLLRKLERGAVPPGARDSGGLLSLEDFQPSLATLATAQALVERELPPPLYARLMGSRFAALPPTVRRMHEVLREDGASGEAEVTRGRGPMARMVCALFGLPPEGRHRLHVAFEERDGVERWTRDFSGHVFSSRLSATQGRLVERFGLLGFELDLPSDESGLAMVMTGWRLGPLPLPRALMPVGTAREWEEEGKFRFDVTIALPLIGPIIRYRGWLSPQDREAATSASDRAKAGA